MQLRDQDWRQVFHAEINTPFCSLDASSAIYPLVRTCIISSPRNTDAACVLLVTVEHRLADGTRIFLA